MAAPSRSAQFTRLHKVLRKHYQPISPDPNRSVLEHLLFACCLENANYAAAEEALAAMSHAFFDFNEIRVSGVRELSETMAGLPDPAAAANRFKRVLQSIFEATYSFDLEDLRKLNLGPAVERLEKIDGTTKFSVAYVVQAALAGHSIPIDAGTLGALVVVDLVSQADADAGVVPGLERAIPKNAGIEFGSLLHQLGADFIASPYTPSLHGILLEIEPAAKERLPSRRAKRPEPEPCPPPTAPPASEAKPAAPPVEGKPRKVGRPRKDAASAEAKSPAEPGPQPGGEPAASTEARKRPAAGKKSAAELPPAKTAEAGAKEVDPKEAAAKETPPKKKERARPPEGAGLAKDRPDESRRAGKRKGETSRAKEGEPAPESAVEGLSKRKPR